MAAAKRSAKRAVAKRVPKRAAPKARKPAEPVRKLGQVEAATERDLAKLPTDLGESALAASALALARELDGGGNSATSKSMCAKAHMEILDRLRELAPPAEVKDGLDDLKARRAKRLARKAKAAG